MTRAMFLSATYDEFAPFMEDADYLRINSKEEVVPNSILVLWGGEDINPELYNHPRHTKTGRPSQRDDREWGMIKRAIELSIPIVGICRGAQMLCAAAGGSLIQDVKGHAGPFHLIETDLGKIYQVNSIHHQQLYLEDMPTEDYKLLAKAYHPTNNLVGFHHQWKNNQDIKVYHEPEAVWFPKIKGLAIQWHPEYMMATHKTQEYVKLLVNTYCK